MEYEPGCDPTYLQKTAVCYLIGNEQNVVKTSNDDIVEKDTLVKGKGQFTFSINLPEPSKLLVFLVADYKMPVNCSWAAKIIE